MKKDLVEIVFPQENDAAAAAATAAAADDDDDAELFLRNG